MKIYALCASPRKRWNSDQLLDAFVEGVREQAPEAEVEKVYLYDLDYKGCRSCFGCKLAKGDGSCVVRDSIHDLLIDIRKSDGFVYAAPIYFCDIPGQLRTFLERLMYPGDSEYVIPTAFIYTMNAPEELKEKFHFEGALSTSKRFLESTFRQAPECVYSFNTYQYNDSDAFTDGFRMYGASDEKKERNRVQFPVDLQNAYNAGVNLVRRIQEVQA